MRAAIVMTVLSGSLWLGAASQAAIVYSDSMDAIGSWGFDASRANSGGFTTSSLSIDTVNKTQGTGAFKWSVSHTTATGNDYVDLYRIFGSPIDVRNSLFSFDYQIAPSPDFFSQFHVVDISGKRAEENLPEPATYTHLAYNLGDFDLIESGFDPSQISFIRFRSNGDGSTLVASGDYFIDNLLIESMPEPSVALLLGLGGLLAWGKAKRRV